MAEDTMNQQVDFIDGLPASIDEMATTFARRTELDAVQTSVVPQYARQNLRHCVQYTQYAAVPQYAAESCVVFLRLRVLPFDAFRCGHANSAKFFWCKKNIFPLCFRGKSQISNNKDRNQLNNG